MIALYQLAVLGTPTQTQLAALRDCIAQAVSMFKLRLGYEVVWEELPTEFSPQPLQTAAAVFFANEHTHPETLHHLLVKGIPVLPVVANALQGGTHLPQPLQSFHRIDYSVAGAEGTVAALLQCVGLLPKQRRAFISYRREEAKEAASQLFNSLSARHFDVFLDTQEISPAEDLQAMQWQKLYDSDVLLMLDTPGYFDSRWSNAEFGRVLAKGISVLRVGWPGAAPSSRTAIASRTELLASEIDPDTGRLEEGALDNICFKLEEVRSQNQAVRMVNLVSSFRNAIHAIGGVMLGVGANMAVHIRLPDHEPLVVYPTVGVPTPVILHEALNYSPGQSVAVLYDDIGLDPKWMAHLEWLQHHGHSTHWIKATDAARQLSQWGH